MALARHKKVFLFEAVTTQYLENYAKIRELLPRVGTVRLVQCNSASIPAGTTPSAPEKRPRCSTRPVRAVPDGSGRVQRQLHRGPVRRAESGALHRNVERGIDTSGILTMDYTGFKAVSMAAKDCAAPARCIIQARRLHPAEIQPPTAAAASTFHPNEGKEEHYNLNGGRPREAAEFETFARAMESGDQELCTRMQDTSIAVSRVLTVARRSAGIRFPGER